MKKIICVFLAVILAFSAALLTGCDDEKNNTKSDTKSTSATSSTEKATSATEKSTSSKTKETVDIKTYLDGFTKGKDAIYGAWEIEGFGYMTIVFRNDDLAELIMGTEGFLSKYGFNEENKTLTVQLMPNVIDGAYTYEFSDNNKKLTLTLNDNTLVLNKQNDFSLVPEAPKNPKIDKDILGWWENENGFVYCFQEDGIMYENGVSRETCYTYSAGNGKIKGEYVSGDKMTDNFTYEFKNGKLILDDMKCKRKDMK